MITATVTIDPRTGSHTYWWEFGEPLESFRGQPSEAVDDYLMAASDSDVWDLSGLLGLFGYKLIGRDDLRECMFWARGARLS